MAMERWKPGIRLHLYSQWYGCVDAVDGLSVVIAAGPYSTSDNILYEPLNDLINCLNNDSPPDVCVLVGDAFFFIMIIT